MKGCQHMEFSRRCRAGMAGAGVLFLAALISLALPGHAQSPQQIADEIPPSVSEVIVGGQWGDADDMGSYRAVVLYRMIQDIPTTDILVQWLAFAETGPGPRIVHSEKILTVEGEPAATTFVAFDFGAGDAEVEATRLLIGSFDPEKNEDDMRFVRLGGPAEFTFVEGDSGAVTGQ